MSFLRLPTIGKHKQPQKRLYDTSLLWKAYQAVKDRGLSVYKAARVYGIPESTLRDRTLGLQPAVQDKENIPRSGAATVFTRDQEKRLVKHVSYMASIGYGYSRHEFLNLVTDYAQVLGSRTSSDPALSHSWFTGFKKRNPEIILSKPQKLSIVRAKSTSKEVLDNYFLELEKVMTKYGVTDHSEYIWNTDETGLQMEHSPLNVVSIKGQKPQAVTSNRGKTVTVLATGSATGTRIPPYFVFPGKRWRDDLLDGACPGSAGTMSETGWSNSSVCLDFFENHFKKYVPTGEHTVLVLFDGHKSHINLTLANWGEANNVAFFVLPPHTSHITQPLDVGCFGPLKNTYYSECQAYMRKNPGMQINRYNIAEIAGKAYNKRVSAENLISSFRKTGIYPLNRQEISDRKTAPSIIYKDQHAEEGKKGDQENDKDMDGSSFLDSKKITTVPRVEKPKRKCQPAITGDILSPSKKKLLKEAPLETPSKKAVSSKESRKKIKVTPNKSSGSASKPKPLSPVPCTSGVYNVISDSSEMSDDELDDGELCCVCNKATPDSFSLLYQLEFIQWAQCDSCGHWTHLKYCSKTRCLRRGDSFLCPHCET